VTAGGAVEFEGVIAPVVGIRAVRPFADERAVEEESKPLVGGEAEGDGSWLGHADREPVGVNLSVGITGMSDPITEWVGVIVMTHVSSLLVPKSSRSTDNGSN
jgi:hypothetical protein